MTRTLHSTWNLACALIVGILRGAIATGLFFAACKLADYVASA